MKVDLHNRFNSWFVHMAKTGHTIESWIVASIQMFIIPTVLFGIYRWGWQGGLATFFGWYVFFMAYQFLRAILHFGDFLSAPWLNHDFREL